MTGEMDRVEVTLARIEERLASQVAKSEETAVVIRSDLKKIDRSLRGNGGPGLVSRVDTLEKKEAGRARLMWLAITTAMAALVAWVRSVFK